MTPGKKSATVLEHSIQIAQNSGTWSVAVLFDVEDTDGSKANMLGHIWLTKKADKIARKSLKAIGFDPDSDNLTVLDENPVLLAGKKCEVVVAEEEFKGEKQLKIQWINPVGKPKSKDEMDKMTQMLRDAKSEGEPAPTGSGGENIPF